MTQGEPFRLLVVEDEAHIAAGLKLNLELEGYVVDVAATARDARALQLQHRFDVIILDVMLPDMSGFDLLRGMRAAGNRTPVLMLTARSSAADRVTGLDAGADDYLAKPFELDELLARVRSKLRRSHWDKDLHPPTSSLSFGDARVDFDIHEATVGGQEVQLTQLEIDLVRYFGERPGLVIGRDELLENVWKLRNYPNTRTVDNFIVRLRRHFEADPQRPVHFLSVRGRGYKFVP